MTDALRDIFFQECEEQIEAMTDAIGTIAHAPSDIEALNTVFRSVHSIKGGAGSFRMDDLVSFAHDFETILDELRNERLAVDAAMVDLLYRAGDVLQDLVLDARDGTDRGQSAANVVRLELERAAPGAHSSPAGQIPNTAAFVPMPLQIDGIQELPTNESRGFVIRFEPSPDLFLSGNEPLLLLRELSALGEAEISCQHQRLLPFDELDIETSYLSWSVTLRTDCREDAIHDVFEFVESLAAIEVTPLAPESGITPPEPTALEPETAPARQSPAARPTIRVDPGKIDRLVDLIGEVTIQQSMLAQAIDKAGLPRRAEIRASFETLRGMSRDVQEQVMSIRAQPVKSLYQRMERIVREASSQTGKLVRLETLGEETEVDKNMVEKLAEPLTHIVRNAVDHGIEDPATRAAAGKPETGVVRIAASHKSGRVHISVSDDGAGIDREKVLARAIQRGLCPDDADLGPSEISNLLFLPGFSTAEAVSTISGRGVGMDVVQSAIQGLGGRIGISSDPGQGSEFSISLPLTLAVMDGMVVEIGAQKFVVPLSALVETLVVPRDEFQDLGADVQLISTRGQYVPVLDVGNMLKLRPPRPDPENGVLLLIKSEDGVSAALLVDRIVDQRQLVIKSLQTNYRTVPGLSAATVMGDGSVAFILSPGDLIAEMKGGRTEVATVD